MTSEQFAYWLQGFTELNGDTQPTPAQWKSITEHLQTVFVKVTPQVGHLPTPAPGAIFPKLSDLGPKVFADPARHMTSLELLERGAWPFDFGRPVITC